MLILSLILIYKHKFHTNSLLDHLKNSLYGLNNNSNDNFLSSLIYLNSIETNFVAKAKISYFLECFQKFSEQVGMFNLTNQNQYCNLTSKFNFLSNFSENLSSLPAQTNVMSNNANIEQNVLVKEASVFRKDCGLSANIIETKRKEGMIANQLLDHFEISHNCLKDGIISLKKQKKGANKLITECPHVDKRHYAKVKFLIKKEYVQ